MTRAVIGNNHITYYQENQAKASRNKNSLKNVNDKLNPKRF